MAKELPKAINCVWISIFFFFSTLAQSAEITKIKKSKSLVFTNGGKEDFKKNQKVCFYSDSNEKLGCGRVRKLSKSKSLIKVPRSLSAKLKKGQTAQTEEMELLRQKKADSSYLFSPKLSFNYSILPAYSYNNFAGLVQPDLKNRTLFEEDSKGPSGFSFFSGIELDIHIINLSLGFDLLTLPPDIVNLSFEDGNEAVETLYEFSNRFYMDYTFLRYYIHVGLGVQATYHGMLVKLSDETIMEDDDTSISQITYSTKLLTLAARIPISYEFLLKPVGFFLKVTPIISFYSIDLGSSASYTSDEREGATSHPFKGQIKDLGDDYIGLEEDIKAALGFNHNLFSLDVSVGFFVAI